MKYSKWVGLVSAVTVILVCYVPWVYISSAHLTIGGMFASAKHNFGRPGLMNIICCTGAAVWFMLPRIWAKRTNIFFCGFNVAWALRNFILLSRCYGGECPVKQTGLYVLVAASAFMLLMAFLPDLEMKQENTVNAVESK